MTKNNNYYEFVTWEKRSALKINMLVSMKGYCHEKVILMVSLIIEKKLMKFSVSSQNRFNQWQISF